MEEIHRHGAVGTLHISSEKFLKGVPALHIQKKVQEICVLQLPTGLQETLQTGSVLYDCAAGPLQNNVAITNSAQDFLKAKHQRR
eukprot:Skav209798  [mRNA]  locus=scaffold1201:213262:213552:+ [translate_table: standard]